jgi:RNA polymerase sigma-70 factor (ECF subfamily)
MTLAVAIAEPTARPAELDLESVYRAHFDDVYRMVRHLLGPSAPHADVDDVAQLVFMAVQKALPGFRHESKVSTWVYGIASRVVFTELRRWRRQRRLVRAIESERRDLRAASLESTPEAAVADRQRLLLVWNCLLKMSPKKRIVFVLHEVEGMSGPEISQALGVPEGTVWTRLHHARRELIASIEKKTREKRT